MLEQLLLYAENILCGARKVAKDSCPPMTRSGRTCHALFLSIMEQLEVSLFLINNEMALHSAIHVRSMIESVIKISLLKKHGNKYVCQMIYDTANGCTKICKDYLENSSLSDQSRPRIQQMLNESKVTCDRLKKFVKYKSILSGFVDAGFSGDDLSYFMGQYHKLCSFAHNDIASLAIRHQSKNQNEHSMMYMTPVEPEVIIPIVRTAVLVVMTVISPF